MASLLPLPRARQTETPKPLLAMCIQQKKMNTCTERHTHTQPCHTFGHADPSLLLACSVPAAMVAGLRGAETPPSQGNCIRGITAASSLGIGASLRLFESFIFVMFNYIILFYFVSSLISFLFWVRRRKNGRVREYCFWVHFLFCKI